MQFKAVGSRRGHSNRMYGLCRRFFAFRILCQALPIVFGIAIILAGVCPASSMQVEHFASNHVHANAMSDHAIPAGKNRQAHKAHAACNSAVGCFVLTAPAEEASTLTLLGVTIERTDTAKLATRTVAPPLPPPKIIIGV